MQSSEQSLQTDIEGAEKPETTHLIASQTPFVKHTVNS